MEHIFNMLFKNEHHEPQACPYCNNAHVKYRVNFDMETLNSSQLWCAIGHSNMFIYRVIST